MSRRRPGARREAAPDGPILSVREAPPLQTGALSGDRGSAEALGPAQTGAAIRIFPEVARGAGRWSARTESPRRPRQRFVPPTAVRRANQRSGSVLKGLREHLRSPGVCRVLRGCPWCREVPHFPAVLLRSPEGPALNLGGCSSPAEMSRALPVRFVKAARVIPAKTERDGSQLTVTPRDKPTTGSPS